MRSEGSDCGAERRGALSKTVLARLVGAVLGGAALAMPASLPALAETTIRLAHVETIPGAVKIWQQAARDFEQQHPGVKVEVNYLENEAYKAKLPTMLQSADRPQIIYSWSGGVMRAQERAGYLQDVTAAAAPGLERFSGPAVRAFQIDGKTYGLPLQLSEVVFFYNKALFAKAGVDAGKIRTWDDFLAAVKTLKAAGITPIIVGGGEKWPMHFYWSYLMMRIGGAQALADATAGKDGGFNNPVFVEAGKRLRELAALDPFQPGYLQTTHLQAAGLWGDGKGAIQLMGSWLLGTQANNAADGKGLSKDNIGILSFPALAGGKGAPTDTLGGINGWLITKDAPKEAFDFAAFLMSEPYQKQAAAAGVYIPALKGAEAWIEDPLVKRMASDIAASTYHQIFLDQDLGPSVGRVVNDISVAVAAGEMTPEDAAAAIQQAWDEK